MYKSTPLFTMLVHPTKVQFYYNYTTMLAHPNSFLLNGGVCSPGASWLMRFQNSTSTIWTNLLRNPLEGTAWGNYQQQSCWCHRGSSQLRSSTEWQLTRHCNSLHYHRLDRDFGRGTDTSRWHGDHCTRPAHLRHPMARRVENRPWRNR